VLDHPEWRIGPDVGLLDYSHQEVRGLYLTVLRDIARNYQVDGIVLNWTRFGRHFAGEQRPKAPILTAWLRELRKMLDDVSARQHRRRMLLAHITLATLDESLDHGCDVAQWMKRGLADIVMPMDFLHADFNQPVEQFAAAARGTGCLVYANVHESLGRPGYSITLAKHRALAANHYAWGADGVGTFNMYVAPMAWLRQALPILADAKRVDKGPRHYQFVRPTSASRPVEFGDLDRRYVFTFRMADGRRGEKLRGLLRAFVEGPASPSGDEFAVDVNGVPVAREQMRISFSAASAPAPFAGAGYSEGRDVYPAGLRIEFPLEQCPTFRGLNELGVRWTKRDNANKAPRRLQVVEVLVAS
jgi:hypothetical protein